ncbi:hypothetical protein RLOC_00003764 [Lonchura striata]|uniref:Uncharacterized protein n=1 Tax=Lonchura striata TaxID=40157 RepID=A0A218V8J4_9PASE|nr:hypothetical protein RLOC_00003764 [Lonchura striata domestica]
MNQQKLLSGR